MSEGEAHLPTGPPLRLPLSFHSITGFVVGVGISAERAVGWLGRGPVGAL